MVLLAACSLFFFFFFFATHVAAEAPCPSGAWPAYAHNDYENPRPLFDALQAGFRGAEADVFLVEGELRVAHDRKQARPGRTLQALYLDPLRDVVARCGRVCADSIPFLLNVEIKQESPAAYDTLCAALRRYPDILSGVDHGVERSGPVEVALVGWHPPLATMERDAVRLARPQLQVVKRSITPDSSGIVRLVSLDYGKTIRWSGQSPFPSNGRAWLAALQRAKHAAPGRTARVYNVPARSEIYRVLLDSGVDLIGTKDLAATRRALVALQPVIHP